MLVARGVLRKELVAGLPSDWRAQYNRRNASARVATLGCLSWCVISAVFILRSRRTTLFIASDAVPIGRYPWLAFQSAAETGCRARRRESLLPPGSRATDEIGWFDEETVCSILPDTSADGAGRFADNVAGAVRDSTHQPQVIIYTYPSAWFIDGVETGHPGKTLPQHVHRTVADLLPFVAEGNGIKRLERMPSIVGFRVLLVAWMPP